MNFRVEHIKILCAIAVVLIHTTAFIKNQGIDTFSNYHVYRQILELAVPFFFMATGYVLYIKKDDYGLKYAVNIFAIYVSATIFYILYDVIIMYLDSIFFDKDFYTLMINKISSYNLSLFINGTLGKFHIWYLASTVIAVLIIYTLKKVTKSTTHIFMMSAILYAASLTHLIDLKDLIIYEGFPKALFYISLGMMVTGMDKEKIKKPLIKSLFFIFIFTFIKYAAYVNISEIFLMLSSYYLFIFATKTNGKETVVTRFSRFTLGIYILHVFVYKTIYKILEYRGYEYSYIQDSVINVILLNIFTIIICVLIHKPLSKLFFNPVEKMVKQFFEFKQLKT